jgi:hypothetical protein
MNKILVFLVISLTVLLIGCSSSPSTYDSFSSRQSEFNESDITISENGINAEQIQNILSTKFPPESKSSISVIFLYSFSTYSRNVNDIAYYIMSEGNSINENIEKFVPVPRILIPSKISFEKIQELGIRSLCEYTLIFYNYSKRSMTFRQFINGEFKFESDIEFSLIDNQTTAIIASDRLYSSVIKKRQLLKDTDIEEAESEIYTMQAQLLKEKLNILFGDRR